MTFEMPALRRFGALVLFVLLSVGCGQDGGDAPTATPGVDRKGMGVATSSPDGELGASEEIELLAKTTSQTLPPEMRLFSVQQLAVRGTPETVAPLTRAMMDPDEQVAIAAIEGLPDTEDPAAIAMLKDRAASGPPSVSRAAKRRLNQLQ